MGMAANLPNGAAESVREASLDQTSVRDTGLRAERSPTQGGESVHDHAGEPKRAFAARQRADIGPQATKPHSRRTSAIAVLQQMAGNQAVVGMLQRQVLVGPDDRAVLQRDDGAAPPGLGTRQSPGDNPYRLHLDPEVEAQIRAIEAMRYVVAPAKVHAGLLDLNLPGGLSIGPPTATPTLGVPGAPAQSTIPGPTPATGLSGPRDGTLGDVWKAVMADPALGPAVTKLGDDAIAYVRLNYDSLSTGAKFGVISTSAIIAGGAVGALLGNNDTRHLIGDTLNDQLIPVYKVPGLSVQLNLTGPAIIMGLHLDVGSILPSSLGFGPASESTPLGAPPRPYRYPFAGGR